ncbi:hypothetical protein PR202_ga25563 [Eleusine coracana subsp. coracana]|uniref:Uncharacterized protein n=1 Tax=Eleusine coracana subsp. coracana TaxID=191504 RepID=A0AAV5D9L3_ELECO|nr:hypothetical protein PR202_ga25563 [Eleusine coracana subsp. coracana]
MDELWELNPEGAITGGVSGVVVETALYPIDTIKTRLQAAQGGSTIQWKGLYAGLAGNIDGVLPASAVFVGVYEPAKRKVLEMFPENLSSIADLVVKQRMQMIQFKTAPDAVRFIVAKEGIKGLYAAKRDLKGTENAIIGAFAGAITGALTTPLDVMKTRLMIQGQGNQYRGFIDCAQTILREEGAGAFLKGIEPRVLWIGIGGSIFFGVLEKTKSILAERNHR